MNSKLSQHLRFKGLPLFLMLSLSLVLAGGLFWMSSTSKVSANFPDDDLVASTYPNIVGTRIDSCSFCHTTIPSLNPYGLAYKARGRGSASSLTSIENIDSDQDGATNIQEIMALTFPGDSKDFPPVPTATKTNTPTSIPPTATKTNTPTSVPPANTNTPTATSVGPTATKTNAPTSVPPTATSVDPTATKTATSTDPTATRRATVTTVPSATTVPSVTTVPSATKVTSVTKTPGVRSTPAVQCVKDDDRRKSTKDSTDHGRTNPCPRGHHPRGEGGDDKKGDDDFFKQVVEKITTLLKGKKP